MALASVVEYLPALACPALMIFSMRGMMRSGRPADNPAENQSLEVRRLALHQEMLQLDRERLARGEITPEEYLRLHGAAAPVPAAPEHARFTGLAVVASKRRSRAG
jgi:uncharacterized membrane protein